MTSSIQERLGLHTRSMSIGGTERSTTADVREIPISKIAPDPDQPRRVFAEDKLDELAASIRESGLLQPIRVRRSSSDPGSFLIIAGERRWRACQRAGVDKMLAIVTDEHLDIGAVRIEQAAENLIREDLNAIDEARSYRDLLEGLAVSQAELARRIGKSAGHLSRMLSLLELDDETMEKIVAGELTAKDALAMREPKEPSKKSGRRRRRLPPGHYETPAGRAVVKRGKTLADLVACLSAMIEAEKRDAA